MSTASRWRQWREKRESMWSVERELFASLPHLPPQTLATTHAPMFQLLELMRDFQYRHLVEGSREFGCVDLHLDVHMQETTRDLLSTR